MNNTVAQDNEIVIDRSEYNRLWDAQAKLYALEAAGVDNWEGYDDAMQILRECEGEDE